MKNELCPICKSDKWKYRCYTEFGWGIVEQHGYCSHCGYTVEQCYSDTIAGFELDQKRGKKYNGKWYGKNVRKRKRLKRKFNIKHTNSDWVFWLM